MTKLTRYSDAFWGKKFDSTDGFDALMMHMKQGKKFTKDIIEFLKHRAKLEEDYYLGLSRLCNSKSQAPTDYGTTVESWSVLKQQTSLMAHEHGHLFKQTNDCITRISECINEHQNYIKQEEAKMKECQREKYGLYKKTIDSKKAYDTRCTERENLHTQDQQMRHDTTLGIAAKELVKISDKYDKSKTEAKKADDAYKLDVANLEKARQKWEVAMKATCDVFQKLDEERIDFLRNEMWVHMNTISQSCVDIDQNCEVVRKKLETCSIEADISTFINNKSTGTDRPDPIIYEPFRGQNQSVPSRPVPASRPYQGPSGAAGGYHSSPQYPVSALGRPVPDTMSRGRPPPPQPRPGQQPQPQYHWQPKN